MYSHILSFCFSDLKFECLATWKDGSDMYMYGGFSGPGVNHRQDIYRCFVSSINFNNINAVDIRNQTLVSFPIPFFPLWWKHHSYIDNITISLMLVKCERLSLKRNSLPFVK